MIIGKWNKSVILTYFGLCVSLLGIYLSIKGLINYAMTCLIIAGVCDLFDGFVARKCKRSDEEKKFGIELDSLADVVNFGIFPIIIFIGLGYTNPLYIIVYCIYIICQICRLAYFNISLEEVNKSFPVKYYYGLPVTFSALILPIIYLLSFLIEKNIFKYIYIIILLLIALLNILNIKIPKPKGKAYVFFGILAIVVIFLYLVIL